MLHRWLVAGCITLSFAWTPTPIGQRCASPYQTPVTSGYDSRHFGNDHEIVASDEIFDDRLTVLGRNRRKMMNFVPFLLATTMYTRTTSAAEQQRCYSDDPRCSADGFVRETEETKPIPRVTNQITHVAQITYTVGERREEVGFIRIGLYGKDCPESVRQLLLFLSSGLMTMSDDQRSNSIGMQSAPVELLSGGIVPNIFFGTAVEFGVPSQSKAYATARGMRNAGSDFVPQPRPVALKENVFVRSHDVAGLVSIPAAGIGYGGTGSEAEDEVFTSAFLITADAAPVLDSGKRIHRVVGQVIDDISMKNLARLAFLPVQKGLTGAIGGQPSGPPLLKVTIQDIGIQRVK